MSSIQSKTGEQESLTLWQRFQRWLAGKDSSPEPIRVRFPKQGDTDILLSEAQRRKLQQAVDEPMERKSETSVYGPDTQFLRRGSGGGSGGKDGLII